MLEEIYNPFQPLLLLRGIRSSELVHLVGIERKRKGRNEQMWNEEIEIWRLKLPSSGGGWYNKRSFDASTSRRYYFGVDFEGGKKDHLA